MVSRIGKMNIKKKSSVKFKFRSASRDYFIALPSFDCIQK